MLVTSWSLDLRATEYHGFGRPWLILPRPWTDCCEPFWFGKNTGEWYVTRWILNLDRFVLQPCCMDHKWILWCIGKRVCVMAVRIDLVPGAKRPWRSWTTKNNWSRLIFVRSGLRIFYLPAMRAMLGINIFNAKAGALEGDVSFVQRRSTERRQGQCHQTCLGNHRTKGASICGNKSAN